MCRIVPLNLQQRQQSGVLGKMICDRLGVRYHLVRILKLVSCILVHSGLRENLIMFCFWDSVKVRLRSASHLDTQGRGGCFRGVFRSAYILERTWGIGSVPEQYSSKVVNSRVKFWGLGTDWRKWCSCAALQKRELKRDRRVHQLWNCWPTVSYHKLGGKYTVKSFVTFGILQVIVLEGNWGVPKSGSGAVTLSLGRLVE